MAEIDETASKFLRGGLGGFLADKRRSIALLTVWTTLHIGIWLFSGKTSEGYARSYFWPLTDYDVRVYDATEFFVYGVLPWISYLLYWLLSDRKPS